MLTSAVTSAAAMKTAVLTRDLRRDLLRGHPWVFTDAVRLPEGVVAGEVVRVAAKDRRPIGLAYADPEGALALRMLSSGRAEDEPIDVLCRRRLDVALAFRRLLFEGGDDVTGYRLVNGEGDGLPGLVVDRYGDVIVIKTDGPIADLVWDVDALAKDLVSHRDLGFSPVAIHLRQRSRGGASGRCLHGETPEAAPFREGRATFHVDVAHGQKTGFFLDQREHRMRIGRLARGRRVLNVFGYTGGFSVHAGLGGAGHVTTVDLAPAAIAQADASWRANGLPPAGHAAVTADAFEFLAQSDETWDVVVLDPPAFAPSKKAAPQALAAYQRLATLGARVTAPDGLFLFASCSAHVTTGQLLDAIEQGVAAQRRRADVLTIGGQPPDHPYPLVCPELGYLKAVYLRLGGSR